MSDESTSENYINNLLTLVIWKCVYDQIVQSQKNVSIFFLKNGVLKGSTMLPRGGGTKTKNQ